MIIDTDLLSDECSKTSTAKGPRYLSQLQAQRRGTIWDRHFSAGERGYVNFPEPCFFRSLVLQLLLLYEKEKKVILGTGCAAYAAFDFSSQCPQCCLSLHKD